VIVGAGPGAADLLTVRAAQALARAQVVLHDDLVPAEVLALCPESARRINVGKRCGRRGAGQEQINALMIEHARAGRFVVRLKSGDPSVFGRLGEELDALREARIRFEVIPGVTAAVAAAAAAEITLTDRRLASTLVVLTGHNADEVRQRIALGVEQTTIAVYMPGPDYHRTARELMALGIDAEMPCALVSHAGRSTQQVRFLSLDGLASIRGVVPPAVLIVGEVARRNRFSEILRLLAKQPSPEPVLESPASQ
jgi:uroporphyrin-III C-methyltransferase